MKAINILLVSFLISAACINHKNDQGQSSKTSHTQASSINRNVAENSNTIHVVVALCDNKYQGIIPVPETLGNGQHPDKNLYWGALYGLKTFFKKSNEWDLVHSEAIDDEILERIVFKHHKADVYLVADAYDGRSIKKATTDFIQYAHGQDQQEIEFKGTNFKMGGSSRLLAYIGHDGLMDFQLNNDFQAALDLDKDTIVLACYSQHYFKPYIEKKGINPLVWSTGLMSPEAYTLHDAITGYLKNESNEEIRLRAAQAYSKYQKCSLKAAQNLLVTSKISN